MALYINVRKKLGEPGHYSLDVYSNRMNFGKTLTFEQLCTLEREIVAVQARRETVSGDVGFDPDPEDDLPF